MTSRPKILRLSYHIDKLVELKKSVDDYRYLAAEAPGLNKNLGVGYFTLLKRSIRARREKYTIPDAVSLGLFTKENTHINPEVFISRNHFSLIQSKFNPQSLTRLTENKIIFYKFCETLDLPIPETFAYFYRDIGLRTKNGKSLFGREEIAEFLSGLQSDFVIKPSEGVYGQGVHGVIRNGNEYLSGKGEKISLDIVIDDYIYKNPFNELIIQQRLKCHRFLADLSGSENLQTYRIVTYITENGEIEILLAHLKTIVGNNFIDNNEKGKTGNIISYIDIDKGEIFSVKLTERKGNGAKFLEVHPVSGKKLIGVQLPEFESAVDLVKKAAPHFYPLRTIGWDVGVTDDGIYIIEGNAFWDPVCFNSKFPPILSKLKQDR